MNSFLSQESRDDVAAGLQHVESIKRVRAIKSTAPLTDGGDMMDRGNCHRGSLKPCARSLPRIRILRSSTFR